MDTQTQEATYAFTQTQLHKLLRDTISMFVEYRDEHGKEEDQAEYWAIQEMLDGLKADRELAAAGEDSLSLQLPVSG